MTTLEPHRPPGPAPAAAARRPRLHRWLCVRALLLHLVLVVVAPACLLAGWWQLDRALGGNELSYLYALEWPAFAGVAVWAWWQLLHTERDPALTPRPTPPTWLSWDPASESPELRAYNRYLLELHRSGRRQRRPSLDPVRRRALAPGTPRPDGQEDGPRGAEHD